MGEKVKEANFIRKASHERPTPIGLRGKRGYGIRQRGHHEEKKIGNTLSYKAAALGKSGDFIT